MSDLPPHSLPEYSVPTGTSKITLRLPGTGAVSTSTTNATASSPVKGGSVMLRVLGCQRMLEPSRQPSPKHPLPEHPVRGGKGRSRDGRPDVNPAHSIDIEGYCHYRCDSIASDNLDQYNKYKSKRQPNRSRRYPFRPIPPITQMPLINNRWTSTSQPPLRHLPPSIPPLLLTPLRPFYPPTLPIQIQGTRPLPRLH